MHTAKGTQKKTVALRDLEFLRALKVEAEKGKNIKIRPNAAQATPVKSRFKLLVVSCQNTYSPVRLLGVNANRFMAP